MNSPQYSDDDDYNPNYPNFEDQLVLFNNQLIAEKEEKAEGRATTVAPQGPEDEQKETHQPNHVLLDLDTPAPTMDQHDLSNKPVDEGNKFVKIPQNKVIIF